jgi:PKD repeat protein
MARFSLFGASTCTPAANDTASTKLNYTISDGRGGVSTGTVTIYVRNINDAPVADFVASQVKGPSFKFTAIASDVDNDMLTYNWSFGDGSAATTSVASTAHDYNKRGTFTVTLIVTNSHGGSAVITKTVA